MTPLTQEAFITLVREYLRESLTGTTVPQEILHTFRDAIQWEPLIKHTLSKEGLWERVQQMPQDVAVERVAASCACGLALFVSTAFITVRPARSYFIEAFTALHEVALQMAAQEARKGDAPTAAPTDATFVNTSKCVH